MQKSRTCRGGEKMKKEEKRQRHIETKIVEGEKDVDEWRKKM